MKPMVAGEDNDDALEVDEADACRHFKEFYDDIKAELAKFGSLVNVKVCRNHSHHLRGNVYVQYTTEEGAAAAFSALNGRFYAGKQVACEYSPVTKWKSAICGLFDRGRCPRGKQCNFLHVFRNPKSEFSDADRDIPPGEVARRRGGRGWANNQADRDAGATHGSERKRGRSSRSRSPVRKGPRSRSREQQRRRSFSRERERNTRRGGRSRSRSRSRSPREKRGSRFSLEDNNDNNSVVDDGRGVDADEDSKREDKSSSTGYRPRDSEDRRGKHHQSEGYRDLDRDRSRDRDRSLSPSRHSRHGSSKVREKTGSPEIRSSRQSAERSRKKHARATSRDRERDSERTVSPRKERSPSRRREKDYRNSKQERTDTNLSSSSRRRPSRNDERYNPEQENMYSAQQNSTSSNRSRSPVDRYEPENRDNSEHDGSDT